MKLSDHFTLGEFTKSQTALRCGIDNTPRDQYIIDNLRYLAEEICEPIRESFGPFSPNSAYRCLELNRALGSKDTSKHTTGHAIDLEHPRVDNLKLAYWIEQHTVASYILLEFYQEGDPRSGWIHVEAGTTRGSRLRTARFDGKQFKVGFV